MITFEEIQLGRKPDVWKLTTLFAGMFGLLQGQVLAVDKQFDEKFDKLFELYQLIPIKR